MIPVKRKTTKSIEDCKRNTYFPQGLTISIITLHSFSIQDIPADPINSIIEILVQLIYLSKRFFSGL